MSRVKSFSIPIEEDKELRRLITQAAIKNDRSESWVICQALKYYFSNGEPVTEDSSSGAIVAERPSVEASQKSPDSLPSLPKSKGGDSPPSLDAKDFIDFE